MTTFELALRFEQAFRAHPSISSAPGRVNLIGEIVADAWEFFRREAN